MKTALTDRAIKAARPAARASTCRRRRARARRPRAAVRRQVVRAGCSLSRQPESDPARARRLWRVEPRKRSRQGAAMARSARARHRSGEGSRARATRAGAQARTTFAAVIEDYIGSAVIGPNPAKPRQRNPRKILNGLRDVLVPLFGDRPITDLTADDVMAPIELIGRIGTDRALGQARRAQDTAPPRPQRPAEPRAGARTVRFIEMVFNWALDHGGYGSTHPARSRQQDPPARRDRATRPFSQRRRTGRADARDRAAADAASASLRSAAAFGPAAQRGSCARAWDRDRRGRSLDHPGRAHEGQEQRPGTGAEHVVPSRPRCARSSTRVPRGNKGDFIFSVKDGARPIASGGRSKAGSTPKCCTILRERAKARGEDPTRSLCGRGLITISDEPADRALAPAHRSGCRRGVLAHRRPGVNGIYDRWHRFPEKREALTHGRTFSPTWCDRARRRRAASAIL